MTIPTGTYWGKFFGKELWPHSVSMHDADLDDRTRLNAHRCAGEN